MRKKIAFISLFANISGATLALLEIIDSLLKDGDYDVIVITGSRGEFENRLKKRNIPVFKCFFFSWLKEKGTIGSLKIWIKNILSNNSERHIYQILKDEKVDILHINTGISPVGIKSAKSLNIPVIWHIREEPVSYFHREPYDKKLELKCFENADAVITISQYIYDCYRDKFNDNARVIYDGVDTVGLEKIRKHDVFFSEKIHMSLCGYNAFKGHVEAIDALRIVLNKGFVNVYLHFYGTIEPEFKNKLINLVEQLKLNNHVFFEGYVDDMPRIWAETDIGLMCSDGEGFGRVTVEAMAAGALVIGTNKGATPEIIGSNRGFVYSKGNARQLAEKIIYAIENVDTARSYAKIGQNYITAGTFSMARNINNLKELYNSLLSIK